MTKTATPISADAEATGVEAHVLPRRRAFIKLGKLASAVSVGALGLQLPQTAQAAPPGGNARRRVHVMRRITFGPTEQLDRQIRAMGVNRFIDQQLNPASIDDSATQARVSQFDLLQMDSAQLVPLRRKRAIRQQLNGATLVRAVTSSRQLQEVMTDFWSNHFNVDSRKKRTAEYKVVEDQLFRDQALGRFSDLLLASAKSPAMLEYLDNRSSRANGNRTPNENYAREVLELHTVGVNANYDEQDVVEVAHVLSGWSIGRDHKFAFFPNRNRLGPLKEGGDVLGWRPVAPERSIENGESLLAHLAQLPETAQFISWKLCRHFVDDDISTDDALVLKAARAFLANDTQIAPTLRVILRSRTFNRAKGKKVRRPNELLYAMLRASNAQLDISNVPQFSRFMHDTLLKLGQPLFEAASPTGYPTSAGAWINTNSMVSRWNLGFALGSGRLRRVNLPIGDLLSAPQSIANLVDQLSLRLIGQRLQKDERRALFEHLGKRARQPATQAEINQLPELVGLVLASPSFQVR